MERGDGVDYFHDLAAFSQKDNLADSDKQKISAMAGYLAEIHAMKKDSKTLYWRKLRDTIGHGECLMGVFDTYPDGVLSYAEMADIIKKSVDWYAKLKPRYQRLSQIHGDFHPGNIWFISHRHGTSRLSEDCRDYSIQSTHLPDFVSLDRSRDHGRTSETIVTLHFDDQLPVSTSDAIFRRCQSVYLEAVTCMFWMNVQKASEDRECPKFHAPFFCLFRGASCR
jgi:hypothetical protein